MILAQPGHIDHIKRNNAGAVYRLIDQLGPISRIELSKRSQLAPASITKITRELIDAHLVKETEYGEPAARGRPAIGLVLNNEGWQFLSLRLGRGYLTLALHELGGEILVEDRHDIHVLDQNLLIEQIVSHIDLFFAKHSTVVDRVTAIAVSLPGLVNSAQGIVIQMPHYDVHNMPLGAAIHRATGLPVFIGNDTHSWALAEKLFGNAKDVENVVLISINYGVGAGIILDGKVLEVQGGNIGELGHIQIKPFGKRCMCGNNGCLETVASIQAVLDETRVLLAQGHASVLNDIPLTIESLCEAAEAGDGVAVQIITDLGHHLGQAIAIIVNIFNPERILIGSEFNRAKSVLHPAILDCVQSQSLPCYSNELLIKETFFYSQATMPGAALVKRAMYNGYLLMKVIEG